MDPVVAGSNPVAHPFQVKSTHQSKRLVATYFRDANQHLGLSDYQVPGLWIKGIKMSKRERFLRKDLYLS